jgi:hypothetical protein
MLPVLVPITVYVSTKVALVGYLWKNRWLSYDPTWLIKLTYEQYPDEKWIIENLRHCTRAKWENAYYLRFKPYQVHPHAEPQMRNNIMLIDPIRGEVVLDIRADGCISGITFYEKCLMEQTGMK